jgi:two-component system LytT family response regulator
MTKDQSLCVLIVDDESHARARLREVLDRDIAITRVLEATDGLQAVDMIDREHPDLVLLDVQMPGLSGLDVIEAVGPSRMPITVFVTAFDQHAVRAFELHALDFVLKPYSDERFEASLARAKGRLDDLSLRAFGQSLVGILERRGAEKTWLDKIAVKDKGRTELVKVTSIDCIESAGAYVALHVGKQQIVHRAALSELVDRLDPQRFVRVHRSAVVNVDSIVHLAAISHGEFEAVLRHGQRIRVSRTYKALLEAALGQAL